MSEKNKTVPQGAAVSKQMEEIALETHHVFLDTEVYYKHQFNASNPVLETLIHMKKSSKIVLHTTDITLKEIERHFIDIARKQTRSARKALDDYNYWSRRVGLRSPDKDNLKNYTEMAEMLFKDFVEKFGFNPSLSIAASEVNATKIFAQYFSGIAPFDYENSKEFPDAFVLKALDEYCQKNKIKMNIVTGDDAFRRAAKLTDTLIPLSSVGQLTSIFAQADDPGLLKYVQKFLAVSIDMAQVQKAIEEKIDASIFYYDGNLMDVEIDEISVTGDVDIDGYEVLSHSDSLNLILNLKVPLEFDVIFEDTSEAIYDKEDGTYFGSEVAQTQIHCTRIIKVIAKFDDKTGKLENLEVIGRMIPFSGDGEFY